MAQQATCTFDPKCSARAQGNPDGQGMACHSHLIAYLSAAHHQVQVEWVPLDRLPTLTELCPHAWAGHKCGKYLALRATY